MPDGITDAVFYRSTKNSFIYYPLKDDLNEAQKAEFIRLVEAKNKLVGK